MDPVLRELRDGEEAAAGALLVKAFAEFEARLTPDNWRRMHAGLLSAVTRGGAGTNLVAEVDGAAAGFVTYFAPGTSDGKLFPTEWASIRRLGVLPFYRGRGLGRLLTNECIRLAVRAEAPAIGLHTSELMATARDIYERAGFVVVREIEPLFGVRYWILRKTLR